jgi:DNA-binding NtrC family response regulator
MSHVLVVDDEPTICWGFRELLTGEGHQVTIAGTAKQAFDALKKSQPDAVILDVRLPDLDGLTALGQIRDRVGTDVPIIVITAFGNLDTAVRAIQAGAFDYLAKPFHLDQALEVVQRALAPRDTLPASDERTETTLDGRLLGKSPAMQAVFKRIALVAATDAPVLVTGESGTGKEEVAQAIHQHSTRTARPFIPVTLGAMSASVIESELFGHVKGAFTGADVARTGLLEQADGGTVFLDEIGDVPLPMQVKLLRAIERREITPVGDPRPRVSDFRVIAATHRPLHDLVAAGEFREDLLYRLSVFHIHLPPLRSRREDIPLLANHFLQRFGGAAPVRFTEEAIAALTARDWRGNVRELRNAVEHAAIVARGGAIHPEHLPPPVSTSSQRGASLEERISADITTWVQQQLSSADPDAEFLDLHDKMLSLVEPPLLEATLAHTGGNRATAAKLLGIHRTTLRQKLREGGNDKAE